MEAQEKTIGAILREAREAKGLTLAEVEQETSIRSRYLAAVEQDDYDNTPGEVFLKGIIRNYGNFLGLDGLQLVQQYKSSAQGQANEQKAIREVENVRMQIQLKDKRDLGSGTGKFELPVKQCLVGLAAVAVLAAGYFAVPAAVDYFKNRPQSVPVQQAEQLATLAATQAVPEQVTVSMEASDDCWLEVTADDKELFAGMLKSKDQRTFEAKDKLIVKYGNIGVMKLKVNGQEVDLKGEHGVAVKTYTRLTNEQEAAAAQPATEQSTAQPAEETVPAATPEPEPELQAEPTPAPEPAAEPPATPAAEQQPTAQPAATEAAATATESSKQ